MRIESDDDGSVRFDVSVDRRRVEDLQVLQKYAPRTRCPSETVETTSGLSLFAYETFVQPSFDDGDPTERP